MSNILVVAVHPDDETLGCGGALFRHRHQGDTIHWLICTELNKEHPYYKNREDEIARVSRLYAFETINRLGIQTMEVDQYSMLDLVGKISDVINSIKPNVVYLPFKNDVHSDHRKIFEAAYSCTKSFRYPYIKRLLMMETLSETEFTPSLSQDAFIPNVYIDITSYFDKKIEAMKIYSSELGQSPFPRSVTNIEALATYRGSTSGHRYAESFMLLKEIL